MAEENLIWLVYACVMLFLIYLFRSEWVEDRELKSHVDRAKTDKEREHAIHVYQRGMSHRTGMMAATLIAAVVISVFFYWRFAV